MAKEQFEQRRLTGNMNVACKYDDGTVRYWNTTKEDVIDNIKSIVGRYSSKGYTLTLRQLHYQLVTKNWIINHTTAYKKLGSILDDCRYSGIIDWDAIEDRGRIPHLPYYVNSVKHALEDTVDQYRRDRQEGQDTVVELWTEKDALSGILRRSTQKYHIRLVVNKGYTSSSALYEAYKRIVDAFTNDQKFTILYFGDHDPSGLDMVRDIKERLMIFLTNGDKLDVEWFSHKVDTWIDGDNTSIDELIELGYCDRKCLKLLNEHDDDLQRQVRVGIFSHYIDTHKLFNVIPIGLTIDQVKHYKLPPNPTKLTDTRAVKYIKEFGKTCWEVDALQPEVLTSIVEENIEWIINNSMYKDMLVTEQEDIVVLKKLVSKFK